jgi:arylsulfatase A-like enzyme
MKTAKILIALFFFISTGFGQQPNIIYIMADDLGYGDLSCYGRKEYKTPRLDKLAAQGTRFTQAYAAGAVCTPTRAAFMTGRYPARTPVGLWEPLTWSTNDSLVGLTPQYPSIPSLVRESGYKTFLIGKWHLGFTPETSPLKNGYDYFFGFKGGATDYIGHNNPRGKDDLYENDTPVKYTGYMTTIIMDKTLQVLRSTHNKPFFITVMFNAPHWPWQGPGDKPYPVSDTAMGPREWNTGGSPQTFSEMMKQLDEAVGQILDVLDEQNLRNNTVVIFTSDNGGEQFSDMGGLSRKKGYLWEGGIREPAFVRWPAKIPSNAISSLPVITMDWSATILALAGAKPNPEFPLDGINLMPFLTNPSTIAPRTLYWRTFQRLEQKAIRDDNWKYLADKDGEYLFDLSSDAGEKNNLINSQKNIAEKLKTKYAEWEKTLLPPVKLNQ